MADTHDDNDTPDSDDRTRTANERVGTSLPQPPSQRLAAPLQHRDPDRYALLGEHGRGGLGVVTRAHDKELGRDVAIKELLSRGDLGEIRFLREALITARLEHPGIVPIHEAGRWPDGTPFYVMKLVAGRSLKELLAERTSIKDRLELLHHVIAVADAVAYAHKRRIIHRDLKASNVIAGDYGETVVIDWGLAKDLSAADLAAPDDAPFRAAPGEDLTELGRVLGTPDYMAPEQKRGDAVDQRADVYAIGVMLWQLCSLDRVAPAEPRPRARQLRRAGIDRDLITIIQKALAPVPAGRYQDAGELAEDLRAFKSGARIAARQYSLLGLLSHWTRRHRALALTVSTALVIALVGTAIFVANIAAERNRADAANHELVLENAALTLKEDPTASVEILAGYRGTDKVRKERLLAEAEGRGIAKAGLTPHSDTIWLLSGDAAGEVFSLGEDHRVRVTRGGVSTTLATDVSPSALHDYSADRALLAYARIPSGIALLDLKSRARVDIPAAVPIALAVSPDGTRLAALSAQKRLTIWSLPAPGARASQLPVVLDQDAPDATSLIFADASHLVLRAKGNIQVRSLDPAQPPVTIAAPGASSLHARGDQILIGDESGHVALYSTSAVKLGERAVCHRKVNNVRLAARANLAAFTCQDGLAGAARYDAQRGELLEADTFSTRGIGYYVRASADGRYIAAVSDSNTAFLYDTEHRLVTRFEGHSGQISVVAFSDHGEPQLLAGDVNGAVRIWDIPTRGARAILRATAAVYGTDFSPDGKLLVTDGTDRIIRRVQLDGAAAAPAAELRGHEDIIRRVRFSPDGTTFLSYSNDRTIRIWNTVDDRPLRVFADHASVVGDAEYIEGGARIASVGSDGRLLAWSPRGETVTELFRHPLPITALEILRHSGHIVVHDTAGGVWSVPPSGAPQAVRPADNSTITVLRASPEGRLLGVGMADGTVLVYETAGYKQIAKVTLQAAIRQISFDPLERDLLLVSEIGHVRIVALTPHPRAPWGELAATARDAAYTPDGELIAFVGRDGGTWFYSFRSDRWIYVRDHAAEVSSGRFSPDGTRFASTDRSGVVVLRDVMRTLTRRDK